MKEKPIIEIIKVAASSEEEGGCNGCDRYLAKAGHRNTKHTVMVLRVVNTYSFRLCGDCVAQFCNEMSKTFKIGMHLEPDEIRWLMMALGMAHGKKLQGKGPGTDIMKLLGEQAPGVLHKLASYHDRLIGI